MSGLSGARRSASLKCLSASFGVAGAVVQQPEAGVHVRVLGILLQRTLELFPARARSCPAAGRRCRAGCCTWRRLPPDPRRLSGLPPSMVLVTHAASRQQQDPDDQTNRTAHARTCNPKVFEPSRTMVRSVTCPASCPHAASMSSPRVLRMVAITPALHQLVAELLDDRLRRAAILGSGKRIERNEIDLRRLVAQQPAPARARVPADR